MPQKPIRVMPWHKPEPHKALKMQDKAAYKGNLLDHNAALDVDSPVSPLVLTSIVCTISDKMCDTYTVGEMIENGMKVARFDMNRTTARDQNLLLRKFRTCLLEYCKNIQRTCSITIAVELKGSTIITGSFKGNVEKVQLNSGDLFTITTSRAWDDCGSEEKIYVDYDELAAVLQPGDKILLDFGRIELKVRGVVDFDIVCDIVQGGYLSPYSEVAVVGVPLNICPITEKDIEDLNFAVDSEVDVVIVPMVRTGQTVEEVREILGERGKGITIFSKIDCRQAYDNLNEILRLSDGIIVNRGRLSIELSTEKVMQAQKSIVAKANKAGKPVFAVTEYLNSMIHRNCPTLSETSDVLSTVLDGVDGIILMDETSRGDYPALAVQVLAQLCREAEAQVWQSELFTSLSTAATPPVDPAHAICITAVEASFKAHAAGIFIVTSSGKSAKMITRYKPRCPVFAMTRYGASARQMNLYRGILAIHIISPPHPCWSKDIDLRMQDGINLGKKLEIVKVGDPLVLVNSWRPGAGFTNNIRIVCASSDTPWILPGTTDDDVID